MASMGAYCLSIHAGYACAHAGACCTADWPIPIERDHAQALAARGLWRGGLAADRSARPLIVGRTPAGACVFYEPERGGLCAIHREAGPSRLPEACRAFPRVALRDSRGLFVTLSHVCPTAARLLLRRAPIRIVAAPSTISLDGTIEGLDATSVLPPLLRPGMLMDAEAYTTWEREAIAVLNDARLTARGALAAIERATRGAAGWSPECGAPLSSAVADAFSRACVDRRPPQPPPPFEHARRAFLAAHLFASWSAYNDNGVSGVVARLRDALTLLGEAHASEAAFIAAARAADLRLRHTSR